MPAVSSPHSRVDLRLDDLLAATRGTLYGVPRELRFRDVVVDSRRVTPGALFVALRGEKHDAHAFVADALAQGAVGALVERIPPDCRWPPDADVPPLVVVPNTYQALQDLGRFWRARLTALVVGVTGSVGKTTTKEVVAEVLARRFAVMRSEGNLNTEVGMPLTLLRARPEDEVLVLEMGMYTTGDIRLLAEIARPRVGVVTNVLPVHLERLKTIERIQEAKQELVEALPDDGTAILNYDDPRVRAMSQATSARVRYYGMAPEAEVRAEEVVGRGLRGVEFTLVHGARRLRVRMPLLGVHCVHAALAAVAVGLAHGVELEEAVSALEQLSPSLRIVVEPGINGAQILDDTYNASPASALAALNLLSELGGRKVAVLGDMLELGSYEEQAHRLVGQRAGHVADVLVTVGTRARWIADEARRVARPPARIVETRDRAEAIALLEQIMRPGDQVLIKGSRGMQMERLAQALRREREG